LFTCRLRGYDYSYVGMYLPAQAGFITICTQNRECLFEGIVNGEMVLNEFGTIVDEKINELKKYKNVDIDIYCVMPNHVHFIIQIVGAHHDAPNEHYRTHIRAIHESPLRRSLLSQIIGYFKMNSAKTIHITNPNIRIWQRNYYEHIIKNEIEYIKIKRYIQLNSTMWG